MIRRCAPVQARCRRSQVRIVVTRPDQCGPRPMAIRKSRWFRSSTAPAQRPGPRLVSTDSGLQAHGLCKTYSNRPVVRDVSITLQRGEAVGLLGPNGAGKTTTFYMVFGLV